MQRKRDMQATSGHHHATVERIPPPHPTRTQAERHRLLTGNKKKSKATRRVGGITYVELPREMDTEDLLEAAAAAASWPWPFSAGGSLLLEAEAEEMLLRAPCPAAPAPAPPSISVPNPRAPPTVGGGWKRGRGPALRSATALIRTGGGRRRRRRAVPPPPNRELSHEMGGWWRKKGGEAETGDGSGGGRGLRLNIFSANGKFPFSCSRGLEGWWCGGKGGLIWLGWLWLGLPCKKWMGPSVRPCVRSLACWRVRVGPRHVGLMVRLTGGTAKVADWSERYPRSVRLRSLAWCWLLVPESHYSGSTMTFSILLQVTFTSFFLLCL
jgi:hypothetical protein